MTKKEFKLQYSEFRKHVKSMRNLADYREALNLNQMYRSCYLKNRYPVSVKIANHLNRL